MPMSDAVPEPSQRVTFTNRDLVAMIVPLFLEQFLLMLVGLADTFFVSKMGEAAVAGVSLVNQFNTIFIYLFTALAAGGAVVVSQYVGTRNREKVGRASSQLLMFSVVFSLVVSAIVLVFGRQILHLMFGNVEADVMEACGLHHVGVHPQHTAGAPHAVVSAWRGTRHGRDGHCVGHVCRLGRACRVPGGPPTQRCLEREARGVVI